MKHVLITSFEPFGGHAVNSSTEVARALAPLDEIEIDWLTLPVVAGQCVERAWQRIETARPKLVVALGQAGSSPLIRLEDRGTNFDHFYDPDNAEQLRRAVPIDPNGPAILRTTIPLAKVADQLRKQGHPVEVSYSAGSYVCNHLYYQLLARARSSPAILFVHLPLLPEQARANLVAFVMPLQRQIDCVRQIVRTCLD